jgi:hypothetical protein
MMAWRLIPAAVVLASLIPALARAEQGVSREGLTITRVLDPTGEPVAVRDVTQIWIWIERDRRWDDRAPQDEQQPQTVMWTMGPKPEIVRRLEDGAIAVSNQHFLLAKPGNKAELHFETEAAHPMSATAEFAEGDLTFVTPGPVLAGPAPNAQRRAGVADAVSLRLVDPEVRPVPGARVASRAFRHPIQEEESMEMFVGGERAPASDRHGVVVLESGHPVFIFDTNRFSMHLYGLAVDIYHLDGELVVDQRETGSVVHEVVVWLYEQPEVTNIGSPWALDGFGGRSFTDLVHQDHLHVEAGDRPEEPPERYAGLADPEE